MPTPEPAPGICWRVFPWDAEAPPGARFSPSHVPEPVGRLRFGKPERLTRVHSAVVEAAGLLEMPRR